AATSLVTAVPWRPERATVLSAGRPSKRGCVSTSACRRSCSRRALPDVARRGLGARLGVFYFAGGGIVVCGLVEGTLPARDDAAHSCVARDVDGRAQHVEQAVDPDDEGDAFERQADLA